MADMMTFPDTWEEFEEQYGITDREEIYTNGARLIPSFRVKQWLDHIAPSINLDDYVPKDFHDKTCEAMAKRHQEEISDMVSVVRCKECKWWIVAMDENNSDEDYLKCSMDKWPDADDFCSYGERKATEITTDCSWK